MHNSLPVFESQKYMLPSTFPFRLFIFFLFYFIFKLYIIVLVLPNIKMNPPQVYMCSPSWTLLPPPSPYHAEGNVTTQVNFVKCNFGESYLNSEMKVKVAQSCPALWPHGLYMHFLSPGDLPNPRIEPRSPALQADSLPAEPQRKPYLNNVFNSNDTFECSWGD